MNPFTSNMNTRSSTRIEAELEKRGVNIHATAPQKRDLYKCILEVERVLASFNKPEPTHSYNLRSRKTN